MVKTTTKRPGTASESFYMDKFFWQGASIYAYWDYLQEVVSAPLKFWARCHITFGTETFRCPKLGVLCLKNYWQHIAKNLVCRATFLACVIGVLVKCQMNPSLITKIWLPLHTYQPPEYTNLETTPKILKMGAIFISGPFFWISLFSMQ